MPVPRLLYNSLRSAKRQARRFAAAFRRKAIVLVYHRVARVPADPWGLAVTPEHLAEHLEAIRSEADPISLRTLVAARDDRDLPPRPVCVTFDDGYLDNLLAAAPLLEQHRVPATMFLPTGFFAMTEEHWWDQLERFVLGTGARPGRLSLRVAGAEHAWTLAEMGPETAPSDSSAPWHAWKPARTASQKLYQELYQLLSPVGRNERQEALEQLRLWAGEDSSIRPGYRTVTADEAAALAARPFLEIGAHTVTHPELARLPLSAQRDEIESSKTTLERLTGKPVESFAYPYGKKNHYSRDTMKLVRDAGFSSSCSNFFGVATTRTDRFQLPRIQILDGPGAGLAKEMSLWFRG